MQTFENALKKYQFKFYFTERKYNLNHLKNIISLENHNFMIGKSSNKDMKYYFIAFNFLHKQMRYPCKKPVKEQRKPTQS
jgi:hypothetical protein